MKVAGQAGPHKRGETVGENPPAHGCGGVAFKAESWGNNRTMLDH